jgi:hypothetical protein
VYLGPLTSHTPPPPLVITIHMELHVREERLSRASKLYEHVVQSDCDDALLEDVVDRLIEAAEAWTVAFDRVATVEAAALERGYPPNTTTEFWEADQES